VTSSERGGSARIVLHPEELGSVEIRLTYGSDGVSATVRTDSPQAAQTLAQAGGDLKRALEQQGVSLLDLDIRDRNREGTAHDAEQQTFRDAGDAEYEGDETVAIDPMRLPAAGSQIDVFA
jgi:flagellar hook-length control protein FliK